MNNLLGKGTIMIEGMIERVMSVTNKNRTSGANSFWAGCVVMLLCSVFLLITNVVFPRFLYSFDAIRSFSDFTSLSEFINWRDRLLTSYVILAVVLWILSLVFMLLFGRILSKKKDEEPYFWTWSSWAPIGVLLFLALQLLLSDGSILPLIYFHGIRLLPIPVPLTLLSYFYSRLRYALHQAERRKPHKRLIER